MECGDVFVDNLRGPYLGEGKRAHNIVKVAVDPQGDSRVDPQTTLTML